MHTPDLNRSYSSILLVHIPRGLVMATPEDLKLIHAGYHANWLPEKLRHAKFALQ